MSSTGLYSGLYQTFYATAALVDDVLVTLQTQNACDTDDCRRLGQLLINLATDDTVDISARILNMALRGKHHLSSTDKREAGEALLSSRIDHRTLDILEEFARALEQVQVQSLARMREGVP
jgi:hypothetical protein